MNIEEAKKALNELEQKEAAYHHAMGLISYDGVTGAPKDSTIPRSKTAGVLSGELYRISTSEDTIKLVDYLEEHIDELDAADKRRTQMRAKDLRELRCIPMDEYVAYQELLSRSSDVWHEAKEKSDYKLFEPYLDKIIKTDKRIAGLTRPDMDPYDYWLDSFEEGLTRERCDTFFSALRESIVPLVEKVKKVQKPDNGVVGTLVPKSAQQELSDKLMEIMGIDKNRCTLRETEHPFTTDFSKYDVRITTNYKEDNFLSSMYSVIHEGGHALYELHTADEFAFTNLGSGVSMGVHESQSRFYENIIGRSKEYINLIYPHVISLCPELSKYSAEDIYIAANKAEPSLIRTEADELTYCLHIMIRYEMEKAFIDGDVPTKELPDMWNALYKEYLGIDVPDDKHGILQDSHWSSGLIGYFPSYALGSAYGAQLLAKMGESFNVYDAISAGKLSKINDWLTERIWKYGRLYNPTELIEKAMEAPFDPTYYINYLKNKMSDIYGI